jgi:Lrp/AsnC family transcriptional regulator for asnA, asnC and gidA
MTKLSDVDYQIISLLQEDGRMPTVEIARRTGVSEGTVRRRLAKLIQDEVLRITAVVSSSKVGFPFKVRFALMIEIDKYNEIAQALYQMEQIRFAHLVSGSHDILAEAWFRTMDELVDFIINDLANIPGIHQFETFYVQKEIKRAHFHDHDVLSLLSDEGRLVEQEEA